jgi:arylformamidase
VQWLVNTYHPTVIGTDAGGFEVPGTDYQPNHLTIFRDNIAMIESATNLAAIGDRRVKVYILPLPIEGIEACPVRIIAEPLEA